jgi:hypothetical protein
LAARLPDFVTLAGYVAPTTTIDVTDYREIKAPEGPFEVESLRSQHCYSHLQLTGP